MIDRWLAIFEAGLIGPVSPDRVVSVPKFSPIPRLSIVVPVGGDIAAFENTLISVLENRPQQCEVIVAHHGNYDDPFSLTDEVDFVVTDSSRLTSMIVEAAGRARGRIVHVLAEGMIAVDGWTDPAMEAFEHRDVAIVAPLVRDQTSGRILAAGWSDTSSRLFHRLASGRTLPSRRDVARIDGAYLQASFWRRDVLCQLGDTLLTNDTTEAVYAHTLVAREEGWRTQIAVESEVYCATAPADWTDSSFSRGQRLRAIRDCVTEISGGVGCGAVALARNVIRPSWYAESIGQSFASLAAKSVRKRLDAQSLALIEDPETTTIQINQSVGHDTYRRAA